MIVSDKDSCDQNDEFFNDQINTDNRSSIRQYLRNKFWTIRFHNYKTKNICVLAKFLRHKLNFVKAPKKKGYGQYFTDDEKRYYIV